MTNVTINIQHLNNKQEHITKWIEGQNGRDTNLLHLIEDKINPSFEAKDRSLNNAFHPFESKINEQHQHINSMNNQIHQLQNNLGNINVTNTLPTAVPNPQNHFADTHDNNRNDTRKINDALRLLGNNFTFDGNERKWMKGNT